MFKRIFIVCLSLFIGYFAIYFGDGLHMWVVAERAVNHDGVVTPLSITLATVVSLIGVILWAIFFQDVQKKTRSDVVAIYAGAALVCLGCGFGAVAAPTTNYGPYPWHWASRWEVFLLLALVPIAVVICGILADIAAILSKIAAILSKRRWGKQQQKDEDIRSMRRSG